VAQWSSSSVFAGHGGGGISMLLRTPSGADVSWQQHT
jgi:hypothetical protein